MNIVLSDEDAEKSVQVFRDSFPEIPLLWRNLEDAAKRAIMNPGQEFRAYACAGIGEFGPTYKAWPFVSYYYDGTFLYCGLPSGRTLFYYKPEILGRKLKSKKTGNDYWTQSIHYWGKKQESGGAWQFISTWGGMASENICQATCRDVLYNGLELIDKDPEIEVCGTSYDEAIALSDQALSPAIYERMVRYMTTPAPWMDGRFFLGADGYHSAKRYKK
jgi:DNA polymerase